MALVSIVRLDRVIPVPAETRVLGGAQSPIREVTRQIAFEPGGWTPERAAKVTALFNDMAPGWADRLDEHHPEPLVDALARGGPFAADARVCEVGSGTGALTPVLTARFPVVAAVEIAPEMARRAPADAGHRVLGDGSQLPCGDGAFDVLVLFNAFLFPAEVERALAPDGVLVWVSGNGGDTPIYLPATDVGAALPGPWTAVTASAGAGEWATFRRAR